MTQYLNFEILPSGNLKISLTKDGKEELIELVERNDKDYTGIWLDLLESHSCNGSYQLVMPEKIGALTDAPIIALNVTYDENGEIDEYPDAQYWWFPQYMVEDEFENMLLNGYVIFTAATEKSKPTNA